MRWSQRSAIGILVGGVSLLAQTNAPPAEPKVSAASEIEEDAKKHASASTSSLKQALTLYRTGRFEEAAQKYQQLLQAQPQSREAYAGLTRVYLKQKMVQQAQIVTGSSSKELTIRRMSCTGFFLPLTRHPRACSRKLTGTETPTSTIFK
jgi:TolA-binding protein